MNTLVYTLGIKAFVPPVGTRSIHSLDRPKLDAFIKPVTIDHAYQQKLNEPVPPRADIMKKAIYQLICDGCETCSEIAAEMYRSVNCVREYLNDLVTEGTVNRYDTKKSKSRYFDANIDPDYLKSRISADAKQAIPSRRSKKNADIRLGYLKMISSGINTSVSIAKTNKTTVGGVTTTLYRMEKDGLIKKAGKTRLGGVGNPLTIWEVA
jgi:predicted transcriptional regulator